MYVFMYVCNLCMYVCMYMVNVGLLTFITESVFFSCQIVFIDNASCMEELAERFGFNERDVITLKENRQSNNFFY